MSTHVAPDGDVRMCTDCSAARALTRHPRGGRRGVHRLGTVLRETTSSPRAFWGWHECVTGKGKGLIALPRCYFFQIFFRTRAQFERCDLV